MKIIMNESLGSLEYDSLINSAYPADIIHAKLASGYGKLERGYLIAKDGSGNLIPWGSDITDDLIEVLTATTHEATKTQAGLDVTKLTVFAADFLNETKAPDENKKITITKAGLDDTSLVVTARKVLSDPSLSVTSHVATKTEAGLDISTLVVKDSEEILEITTDYTVTYEDNVLTITLVDGGAHYNAATLAITCAYLAYEELEETIHYAATYATGTLEITLESGTVYTDTPSAKVYCEYVDDLFIPLTKTTDYTATYAISDLTITLVAARPYYNTPKVKVVCPYAYDESTIAAGNLVLSDDVDTGDSSGSTVVAKAYRTGIFNQKRLLHDAKALGGITDITKEKLRSVGIYLNDSISL